MILTESGQGGKVHRGFKHALAEVWEEKGLFEYIKSRDTSNRTIWFTGHSLGAALATLAANRYGKAQGLYTFGSPAWGMWISQMSSTSAPTGSSITTTSLRKCHPHTI